MEPVPLTAVALPAVHVKLALNRCEAVGASGGGWGARRGGGQVRPGRAVEVVGVQVVEELGCHGQSVKTVLDYSRGTEGLGCHQRPTDDVSDISPMPYLRFTTML